MSKTRVIAAASIACLGWAVSVSVLSQGNPSPPDVISKAIADRRVAMGALIRNANRIEMMVYGLASWNADDARRAAEELVRQASSGYDLFPPGSTSPESKAKPEIWAQRELFQQRAESSRRTLANLAVATQGGSLAQVKSAYALVTPACVACHTDFMRN